MFIRKLNTFTCTVLVTGTTPKTFILTPSRKSKKTLAQEALKDPETREMYHKNAWDGIGPWSESFGIWWSKFDTESTWRSSIGTCCWVSCPSIHHCWKVFCLQKLPELLVLTPMLSFGCVQQFYSTTGIGIWIWCRKFIHWFYILPTTRRAGHAQLHLFQEHQLQAPRVFQENLLQPPCVCTCKSVSCTLYWQALKKHCNLLVFESSVTY